MSTILYSHSYPPSNISISPTESFLYPKKIDKQLLLKANGNLNSNNNNKNILNTTKRKHKFTKSNNYKKADKNNSKTKKSIFSTINSINNCSIPIITPVTVHCTHEKDFSKSELNTHSTPIDINSNKLNNHNQFNSYNITSTNLSPFKDKKLYFNDKNYLYSTSESPSMEDYMPTSELNNIKPQETEDEMLSLFNKSGEAIKTNSFDDINFQNIMNHNSLIDDNSTLINAN